MFRGLPTACSSLCLNRVSLELLVALFEDAMLEEQVLYLPQPCMTPAAAKEEKQGHVKSTEPSPAPEDYDSDVPLKQLVQRAASRMPTAVSPPSGVAAATAVPKSPRSPGQTDDDYFDNCCGRRLHRYLNHGPRSSRAVS